jgi:hypothetical protein
MSAQIDQGLQALLDEWQAAGVSVSDQLERLHVAVHALAVQESDDYAAAQGGGDSFDNMPV